MRICEACKDRPATIHVTEIVDRKPADRHLCRDCGMKERMLPAREKNMPEILEIHTRPDAMWVKMEPSSGMAWLKSLGKRKEAGSKLDEDL